MTKDRSHLTIGGRRIRRGETKDVRLLASQTYTGEPIPLPVRVMRAKKAGPVVFIAGAVHGDEINGTGVIRELMFDQPPALVCGTLICMPVVNVFGFENRTRYMPDRRDLNRCFPGSLTGSLASRYARMIMNEIVRISDFGLDLHSASADRTNFPNVRGDLSNPDLRSVAKAFGCELLVNGIGPEGTLRRAATESGCPTLILEAGEVGKVEPTVLEAGLRGVENVLSHLKMTDSPLLRPAFQTRIKKTRWIRAQLGGLLRFHVAPGDIVSGGQPIATNESVFGEAQTMIIAPEDGIILGMSTHPAVRPGEPVCHLAIPRKPIERIRMALSQAPADSLHNRLRNELATRIMVSRCDGYV